MRCIGIAWLLLSTPALASSNGGFGAIGSSGIHGPSPLCNICHRGGAAPTVELIGPAAVEVGAQARYRLTVRGGAGVVAGFSAEVSDPDDAGLPRLFPGSGQHNTRDNPSEVVHSLPQPFAGGAAEFEFTLQAPPEPRAVTLYAAGNSCNGDGTTAGDAPAGARLRIAIVPAGAAGCTASSAALAAWPSALVALEVVRRRRQRSR